MEQPATKTPRSCQQNRKTFEDTVLCVLSSYLKHQRSRVINLSTKKLNSYVVPAMLSYRGFLRRRSDILVLMIRSPTYTVDQKRIDYF